MSELKPCPFCGGSNVKHGEWTPASGEVYCVDCSASGPEVRGAGWTYPDKRTNAQRTAIAWNRRADLAAGMPSEEWLKEAERLAMRFAHVYSYVECDTMPNAKEELFAHLRRRVQP